MLTNDYKGKVPMQMSKVYFLQHELDAWSFPSRVGH